MLVLVMVISGLAVYWSGHSIAGFALGSAAWLVFFMCSMVAMEIRMRFEFR